MDKDKFLAYEDVRASGVTNMWDTNAIQTYCDLSREEINNIRKNYEEYANKWLIS